MYNNSSHIPKANYLLQQKNELIIIRTFVVITFNIGNNTHVLLTDRRVI